MDLETSSKNVSEKLKALNKAQAKTQKAEADYDDALRSVKEAKEAYLKALDDAKEAVT